MALAAVLNAVDLRGDALAPADRQDFLRSVRGVMARMYPKTREGRKGRRVLAGMFEQLRALVDPPLGAETKRATRPTPRPGPGRRPWTRRSRPRRASTWPHCAARAASTPETPTLAETPTPTLTARG